MLLQGDVVSETNEFDDEINFVFSPKLLDKLDGKHDVTKKEVIECVYNSDDEDDLEDTREQHKTVPPTHWCLDPCCQTRRKTIGRLYQAA